MTQERKSNTKVTALAIICVILVASTVGTLALYIPNQSQIVEKDQAIASLNQQISALQDQIDSTSSTTAAYSAQISSLQSQLTQYNQSLTSLISEYQNLQKIASLSAYGSIFNNGFSQSASETTSLWSGTIDYAGYVTIQATSNVTSTYAEVRNVFSSTYSLAYNQTIGTEGTVVFAVLPGTLEVVIGNINEAASVNATAVYHY